MRWVAVDISQTSFVRRMFSSTIRTTAVIVRLDRTIQYSETAMIERIGRRALDAPPSRGITAGLAATLARNPASIEPKQFRRSFTMSWQPSNDPVLGDP